MPKTARATDSHAITKAEWASYLLNPELKAVDIRLNCTYKRTMSNLPPDGKKALLTAQRAWLAERNKNAFTRHAKGSPEYIHLLTKATTEREINLRTLYSEKATAEGHVTVKPIPQQPKPPKQRETPVLPLQKKPQQTNEPKDKKIATDLTIKVQPSTPPVPAAKLAKHIDITAKRFGKTYNQLTASFNTAPFPLAPNSVSGSGNNRTEHYQIADAISFQFKYTRGNFDKPELITFLGGQFMAGTARHKDEVAYALLTLLKTLNEDVNRDNASKDAQIYGFIQSINNAFTADASRVWRYNGLVYVITYMKKNDLFAMAVNVDESRR